MKTFLVYNKQNVYFTWHICIRTCKQKITRKLLTHGHTNDKHTRLHLIYSNIHSSLLKFDKVYKKKLFLSRSVWIQIKQMRHSVYIYIFHHLLVYLFCTLYIISDSFYYFLYTCWIIFRLISTCRKIVIYFKICSSTTRHFMYRHVKLLIYYLPKVSQWPFQGNTFLSSFFLFFIKLLAIVLRHNSLSYIDRVVFFTTYNQDFITSSPDEFIYLFS